MNINRVQLRQFIETCLIEDVGNGDITTNAIVPPLATTKAIIHAKANAVVAGIPVAKEIFSCLAPDIYFKAKVEEGAKVERGTIIAEIEGNARAILTGERLALNLMQRLSGIATMTASVVEKVSGYAVRIVDTRKTTPGLRGLEKYAVTVGGGFNHRFGLYDAVLIKDNHIKVAGGITQAVKLVKQSAPHTVKIEVEVEDLASVGEALRVEADIIMLDNMSCEDMKKAVDLIAGRALVEASGGINEARIIEVAQTGVDIISLGALTHSVKAVDISLDIGNIKA